MRTVRIGSDERPLEEADPQWINQQINRRRENGETVCVVVRIDKPGISLTLATPTCGGGSGGGQLSDAQETILELWIQRGMNQVDFTGGSLVAFLTQLKRMC